MKQFPFRPVIAGVLIAAIFFMAPFFFLRAIVMVMLIAAVVRLLNKGRGRWAGSRRRTGVGWARFPFHGGLTLPQHRKPARDIAID